MLNDRGCEWVDELIKEGEPNGKEKEKGKGRGGRKEKQSTKRAQSVHGWWLRV